MSATDYRRIIDVGDNPLVGIGCTDGIHIRIDLFGMTNITLDAPAARELVTALTEAIGNAHG